MRIKKECMYHYGKYLRVNPFRQPFQLIHANTEKVMKRLISVNQHNYLEKNTFGRSLLRMVAKICWSIDYNWRNFQGLWRTERALVFAHVPVRE